MKFFITLLAALFFIASPSYAQKEGGQIFVPPGTDFQNNAALIQKILKENSFEKIEEIEPQEIHLSFVHYDYMEPRQFGIVMSVPNAVTGCYTFTPLQYQASFIDQNYMDIKVESYRRLQQKNVHVVADCNKRNQTVSALVVVNSDDLKKRNIQEIRFSNARGTDRFKINITKQSITFIPNSMVAFKSQSLTGINKDRIVHFFEGKESIVALHVPMATRNEDVRNTLHKLAYQSSLTPILDHEALDTSGKDNIFYFIDPNNSLLKDVNSDGYLELGEISVKRPYLSQTGVAGITKKLKVFATRPQTRL